MKRKTGRFGYGYHVRLIKGGHEETMLHIERELTAKELVLLDRDLQLLSGVMERVRLLQVRLEVPLSASLASTLEDITQRYEMLTTISVPPLSHHDQLPLAKGMVETPKNVWLKVVPRQE